MTTIPCYICGSPTEPRIDVRDGKLRPCGACEEVIQETLEELENRDKKNKRQSDLITEDDLDRIIDAFDLTDDAGPV